MSKLRKHFTAAGAILAISLTPAHAQTLLLHFPMESPDNGDAKLHTTDGGTATGIPGKYGKAIQFDGKALLAMPFTLDHAQYPQVTVTAWIKQPKDARGTRHIVSTGADAGYRLIFNGSLAVRAGPRGVSFSGPRPPHDEWVFVAGVVDMAEGWARIHIAEGVSTMSGLDTTTTSPRVYPDPDNPDAEKQAYLFIGGKSHDVFGATRRPLAIDDVRIYAGALSEDQVAAIRDGGAMIGETEKNSEVDIASLPGDQYESEELPGDQYDSQPLPDDRYKFEAKTSEARSVGAMPNEFEDPDFRTPGIAPELDEGSERPVGQVPDEINNPEIGQLPTGAPKPQYDSPEAAEAAARQREEAAREREEATARDQQQALEANGKPRPVGEPKFSGLSGYEGATTKMVDLKTDFLHHIEWWERGDRPCRIALNGEENWGCGETESLHKSVGLYPYPDQAAVGSIEVCSSFNSNRRLKGIRIRGDRINADGSTVYWPNVQTEALNNCKEWHNPVLCPSDTLATGMIVHYNESGIMDSREIVGLQLVCRAIGVD
ncbi:MAG: LamG domain-containing protein [Marinicaulis sp.]|nr:LamG domain-containing protein [Marinicaulis sp.]